MIDHILGRPSNGWKRTEVILFSLAAISIIRRHGYEPPFRWMRKWNHILSSLPAWKIILGTLTTSYIANHVFLLLFLNAPEPLARMYTRNFYRAAWFVTALDAGFLTAHTIKPKFLRDICSILFTGFYLFNFDKADAKVLKKYHAAITVDMLRTSWNKKLNPYLQFAALGDTGILGIRRDIKIMRPSPPSPTAFKNERQPFGPVSARLFFSGSERDFKRSNTLILQIPGGGFVAMPPTAHEDYVSIWARRTKVPIVSLDYDKAPEKPYPWALEQCFDVYRAIVETNGEAIGMEGWFSDDDPDHYGRVKKKPLKIVLAGDSAGGNLCTAVVLKILDGSTGIDVRLPNGLVIIYPAYNFDPACWLPNKHRALFRSASTVSAPLNSFVQVRGTIKPETPFQLPPAPRSINVLNDKVDRTDTWYRRTWELIWGRMTSGPRIPSALTMTSQMSYFTDLIMPPEIMRAISLLLLGTSPVEISFDTDYLLCPTVAPDELLARFPKIHFICGEKDPFVDDMIIFAEKVRHAKSKAQKEWERMKEVRDSVTSSRRASSSGGDHDDFLTMDKVKANNRVSFSTSPPTPQAFHSHYEALNNDQFDNHIFHLDPNSMVQVKILEGVSHGFLMMLALLPEARPATHLCADWCTEMLEDEELGTSVMNPGSVTDLMAIAEGGGVVEDRTRILKAKVEQGKPKKAATTAAKLHHTSVFAENVLERRRTTLAETHDISG
ncbi:alpha/beta-hydrolase [Rhizoclosmatium globosum]|uniref:Alpha/beta-hydrolase n=1 Tax=Rhizoclosmatium globosum TaxID=329046 RepID=A0A1Y2CGC1_9FUNG|nr:alpha/beta-hydrolase [Rhizoclosmatium globosum]|eukprot:ORY45966.1 alpha/beta-hydrolase [Rhizoclosmatium globosum]